MSQPVPRTPIAVAAPARKNPRRSGRSVTRVQLQRRVGGVGTGDGTDDGGAVPVVLGVVGRVDVPVHRVAHVRADELDVTLDPTGPDAATAACERPAEPRVVRAVRGPDVDPVSGGDGP